MRKNTKWIRLCKYVFISVYYMCNFLEKENCTQLQINHTHIFTSHARNSLVFITRGKIGSPPPIGSKKEVLIFRSVNNIAIAPANTGSDNNNSIAVIITDHINKGN